MFRLLRIISANRNFLLFLLLEGISLALLINYNAPQRQAFGDISYVASTWVYARRSNITQYFALRKKNEELAYHNQLLQAQLVETESRLAVLAGVVGIDTAEFFQMDSLLAARLYDFIPCRALRNTLTGDYNTMILNKGSRHGVVPDMGVVSHRGIAGRVVRVGKDFSVAISAINREFAVTARVGKSGRQGVYEWRGGDPNYGRLRHVSAGSSLPNQEMVYTFESLIFPDGIPVGTIVESESDASGGLYEAKIDLATDFYSLGNLYLIEQRQKPQIDTLIQPITQQ